MDRNDERNIIIDLIDRISFDNMNHRKLHIVGRASEKHYIR